jgi:hypothetical protein
MIGERDIKHGVIGKDVDGGCAPGLMHSTKQVWRRSGW